MKNKFVLWFKQRVNTLCTKLERSILSNKSLKCKVVFGPVHSRRLGYVVGINNIKAKTCSYNCIYCPSGKKNCCSVCSSNCLSPFELYISVNNKLKEFERSGKKIDYIAFAGSGEPTLASNLSKQILLVREFGYKIAVFTNSSLLWNENIQENLMFADYVSVKIDAISETVWEKINRPHQRLSHSRILEGIQNFSKKFRGTLTTETTLIKNINDSDEEVGLIAEFINSIKHDRAYFMTPIFPPSEDYAIAPDDETLKHLSELIKGKITDSTMLCRPAKEEFYATDDFENELMGLLALHPVSKDAVKNFAKGNEALKKLDYLIENRIIKEIDHQGKKYFAENLVSGKT
ncbi:MAG: radical SAM protein [Ignavibacteriaceae bacterium]|nr:radical SAM protein [Ignavibacteriaceae bacterium]